MNGFRILLQEYKSTYLKQLTIFQKLEQRCFDFRLPSVKTGIFAIINNINTSVHRKIVKLHFLMIILTQLNYFSKLGFSYINFLKNLLSKLIAFNALLVITVSMKFLTIEIKKTTFSLFTKY